MPLKSQIIRLLGGKTIDGSSIPNLAAKRFLENFKISPGNRIFEFIRKLYRANSRVVLNEKSYSKFGEDRILACYLPELTGSYVDVGSGSPKNGSNTYLFYLRGWTGTTIDPIANIGKLHKKTRPKDLQLVACVSDMAREQVEFHEYIADDFSTDSGDRKELLSSLGINPISTRYVKSIKLSDLMCSTSPLEPSLLDIDVEGNELSVLKSNNWHAYLPRVICIEEWHSPLHEHTSVRSCLEEKGYKLVSRAFITSIYVHSDYLEIKASTKELSAEWFLP